MGPVSLLLVSSSSTKAVMLPRVVGSVPPRLLYLGVGQGDGTWSQLLWAQLTGSRICICKRIMPRLQAATPTHTPPHSPATSPPSPNVEYHPQATPTHSPLKPHAFTPSPEVERLQL